MPGPAPDPNALRRDRKDDAGWVSLPSDGRTGVAPVWPLMGFSNRESELWESLWMKPQAILWEKNSQELEVALFVRRLAEVELPDAPVTLGVLVAKQMDQLLLTLPSMFRARVKVADDEVAARRESAPVVASSVRDRLKLAHGA
jgi:hypothetical protein